MTEEKVSEFTKKLVDDADGYFDRIAADGRIDPAEASGMKRRLAMIDGCVERQLELDQRDQANGRELVGHLPAIARK